MRLALPRRRPPLPLLLLGIFASETETVIGESCDLAARTAALNAECCDETSEDCTGGVPHTCNAGCAAVFEPYWRDCRALLKQAQAQAAGVDVLSILESTFALCSSSGSSPEVNSQG